MTHYKDVTGKDWAVTLGLIAVYLTATVVGTMLMPSVGFVLVAAGGLFLLVRWHNRTYAYQCSACAQRFEISTLTNFLSPHGVSLKGRGWKLLKCPHCQEWTRASIVKKNFEDFEY
jgi:hypothetical protein